MIHYKNYIVFQQAILRLANNGLQWNQHASGSFEFWKCIERANPLSPSAITNLMAIFFIKIFQIQEGIYIEQKNILFNHSNSIFLLIIFTTNKFSLADVYSAKEKEIINQRYLIKKKTMQIRRRQNLKSDKTKNVVINQCVS